MTFDRSTLSKRLDEFWACLPLESRIICPVQPSRRFPELTYLREDLVGNFKARKYTSLVPWLKSQGYRRVLLRGSSHSSNLLQLSLLLGKEGIEASYELEGREGPATGNGLLSRLVLGERFRQSSSDAWPDWVVPEGGSCPASLAGSLGIAGSVVHHILNQDDIPEEIFIDSGTGFTAAALLFGLGYFELPCEVCIVTMARQTEDDIVSLLNSLTSEYERLFESSPQWPNFRVCAPPFGRSYGSTPSTVFCEVQEMAQHESLLVDPLYTAKLSLAYKQYREVGRKAFMFISGGQAELLGFQEPLAKWLNRHAEEQKSETSL